MGFSRQEYWSGLPFPSPEDLPDPGIEPRSPALQADALLSEPPGKSQFTWIVTVLLAMRVMLMNQQYIVHKMSLRGSLVAQTVKNLSTVQEAWIQSLGQEDPLKKGMATHSNILAWKIPFTFYQCE